MIGKRVKKGGRMRTVVYSESAIAHRKLRFPSPTEELKMFMRHDIAALLVLLCVGAANESEAPSVEFVSGKWAMDDGEVVQRDAALAQSFALAPNADVERCVVKARVKLGTDRLNAEAGV